MSFWDRRLTCTWFAEYHSSLSAVWLGHKPLVLTYSLNETHSAMFRENCPVSNRDTKRNTFSVFSVVLCHVRLPLPVLRSPRPLPRLSPRAGAYACRHFLATLPLTFSLGSLLPSPPQLDSAINQETRSLVRDSGSQRLLSHSLSFICLSLAFNKFVPVNKPSKTDPHYLIKHRRHVEKYDT